jgi:hypothetical protein
VIFKREILHRMALYHVPGGGIGSWLTDQTCDAVFERLGDLDISPLSAVQLNQLLVLAHEAPVSDGFFRFYWLKAPELHPYRLAGPPHCQSGWGRAGTIDSLDHLAWGLHRLYADGLMYFGNVRTAFRTLREFSFRELQDFFSVRRIDTQAIKRRGPALLLKPIARDRRYLISETACKSYGEKPQITSDLRNALLGAYAAHLAGGGGEISVEALLDNRLPAEFEGRRDAFKFSASEVLGQTITSERDIDSHYNAVALAFEESRRDALQNTRYYLSLLTDLDVYVATSMRTRDDFVKMANNCEAIFSDKRLKEMNLRYFDPTLSAAGGHEDKGLIECLMVKCAKALVYCRGEKESYGKDAEAAMALSLGKPVIFYCEQQGKFYKDVHPLSRLIQFETGIAVGAMIAETIEQVVELLTRTFENTMVYRLEGTKSDSLRLLEDLTGSVVRLQTSDELLSETFWNHYHSVPRKETLRAGISTVRSIARDASGTAQPSHPRGQERLPLEETGGLVPLAARQAAPPLDGSRRRPTPSTPPKPTAAGFPLSLDEVFDGVSKAKRSQITGAKRFTVFSEWLAAEGIAILEGIRLLRFVEATLVANGSRPHFIYTSAHLTNWYSEMSAGAMVGSRR